MHLSSPVASAAFHSKAVVVFLLIHLFIGVCRGEGDLCLALVCNAVRYFLDCNHLAEVERAGCFSSVD